MRSIKKILFIGSLLPTKKKPEAGIFYYKLIYFFSKKIKDCYLIYPKSLKIFNKDQITNELQNILKFAERPLFLSFG